MRAVVTRVSSACVEIDGSLTAQIGQGFLVLLGVHREDTEEDAGRLADRVCGLRVFEDDGGKMNLNLASVGGRILCVSQFTLFADTRSRRPGFTDAARPEKAIPLYELFMSRCRDRGFEVAHGEFGADMKVASVNDGPVTIIFDTRS